MRRLHEIYPGDIVDYNLTFKWRFLLLEARAHYSSTYDSLRIASTLSDLQDSSGEVHRLANDVLRAESREVALQYAFFCDRIVDSATSLHAPMLEVEARLLQTAFVKLFESTLAEDSNTTLQCRPANIPTIPTIPAYASSLTSALALCRSYPGTAGRFHTVVKAMQEHQPDPDVSTIPQIYTAKTRATERAWGGHVLDCLVVCANMHAYSEGSFLVGCPECGKQVEAPEVEYEKAKKFLREDEFLKMMRGE